MYFISFQAVPYQMNKYELEEHAAFIRNQSNSTITTNPSIPVSAIIDHSNDLNNTSTPIVFAQAYTEDVNDNTNNINKSSFVSQKQIEDEIYRIPPINNGVNSNNHSNNNNNNNDNENLNTKISGDDESAHKATSNTTISPIDDLQARLAALNKHL